MDDYIFKKSIFFIFLIGFLIFMLYFFNPNGILNLISTKEHLVNLYKPNKVFYHNNQIYLMDTQHLMGDENPKIFKTYGEFQKYILDLEDKHLIKLPLDKKKIIEGVDTIKQFKYDKDLSIGKDFILEYKQSKKCLGKESICNMKNRTNWINNFKKENCKNDNLNMENCAKIDVMIEKEDELNRRCFINQEKSKTCEKFSKYRWDLDLLKNFCVKYKSEHSYNSCLESEYFKENLLDF
jgi:hypothetical protein